MMVDDDAGGPRAVAARSGKRHGNGQGAPMVDGHGRTGRRAGAARALATAGVLLALAGAMAGCRSQAPMLQPVAPVPTLTPADG